MPIKKVNIGLYDSNFEHDSCGVGFVCDINGKKTHATVEKGIEVLERLRHRGAVGADPETGDGAGIMLQLPYAFFNREGKKLGLEIPKDGDFAAGVVFLPQDSNERKECEKDTEKILKEEGLEFLGWRDIPVKSKNIGDTAKKTMPAFKNLFVGTGKSINGADQFEVRLYVARKRIEEHVKSSQLKQKDQFYFASLSSRIICYKGLLMSEQLLDFFPDLSDSLFISSLALVHSRYSTNTFPTWDLAQPFRYLAHNGEINTLRGNINWMNAREKLFESEVFKSDIKKILPVIVPGGSDSQALDNVLELLVLSGRPLDRAMMLLIPPSWQKNDLMDKKHRELFEFNSCLLEAWDGPAAVCFTDGVTIGGMLDRNGLRPCRYVITNDGFIVMASEVGVLDINPKNIKTSGRLSPGKMFLVDTIAGKILEDKEIKDKAAAQQPYGKWLKENVTDLDELVAKQNRNKVEQDKDIDLLTSQKAAGYSAEDLKFIIVPMAEKGQEPTGSMGNDSPLAVLSKKPQLLFNYFKQLFAQVTNPPIDPIREDMVMSLESFVGPEKNLLSESPSHCKKLRIKHPVLSIDEFRAIRDIDTNGFKTKVLSTLFEISDGINNFSKALERLCSEALDAIEKGTTFIVLSDRGISEKKAALPILLASSAVHEHLIKYGARTRAGLILESAEPREVMHFALLFGYGADAVCPYLAYKTVEELTRAGEFEIEPGEAIKNYVRALEKGILKILSKMGICLLQSYRGSQIFEALGIKTDVINRYFTGTVSRIEGIGLEEMAKETMALHERAFGKNGLCCDLLPSGGLYQWRRDGDFHLWNPDTISSFQEAVRDNDPKKFAEFAAMIDNQKGHNCTIRSLLKFKKTQAIPINEVESADLIVKRFVTGAMSYGSISKEAHEALAAAMNSIGGKSNSGEGGEDINRFKPLPSGVNLRSSVKQVASGRFGVTSNYLVNADELQIKMAQGAKPGEGGQLPGHKVDEIIAKIRHSIPGVTLISPPPHHDIYSIEDLAQLIFDLKNANPAARISVKLVSEIGVGTIAAGVAKGHADMILISGYDGGTGASPISSIKHAGLPWELGLSETHQTLVMNNLRSRVRLQTDGQLRTGRDVVIASILGAEEFGFASSALIALGCVMLRHCHLNNCSLGIATQDEQCRKRFSGKPGYVVNMMYLIAESARQIMASLGIKNINDLVGRADLIETDEEMKDWKSTGVDLSRILYDPGIKDRNKVYCTQKQDHKIGEVLDIDLIKAASNSLKNKEKTSSRFTIKNHNRTTGAMLSSKVSSLFGEDGLADDTINIKFKGIAGQSFGAFLARGISFELEGATNDYIGKGLSGGKIIVYPDKNSGFESKDNIIVGNTTFYGATSGEAYIRGVAGERFCIRNSGIFAVVEGVGDHGCEYMTGGRVLILGKTGRNFAAGMSGGIAYIYDEDGRFALRCNMTMVDLEKTGKRDEVTIKNLLQNHYRYTGSMTAKRILDEYESESRKIIRVLPKEYKAILEKELKEELEEDSEG